MKSSLVLIFLLVLCSSTVLSMDCPAGFEIFDPLMTAKVDAADKECIDLLLLLKMMQTLTFIIITQAPFLSNDQTYGHDMFSDDFVDGIFNHLFFDMSCIDAALYNFGEIGDKVFPVQFMANIFALLKKVFYVCHLEKEFDQLKTIQSQECSYNLQGNLYVSFFKCFDYVWVFLEKLWPLYHKNFDFSYGNSSMVCLRIIFNGLEQKKALAKQVRGQQASGAYSRLRLDSFEDVVDAFISFIPLYDLKRGGQHLFNLYRGERIEILSISHLYFANK